MNQELCEAIFDALDKKYPSLTPDEHIAMIQLAEVATSGAETYFSEVQETLEHLRGTIKRLNQRITESIPIGVSP